THPELGDVSQGEVLNADNFDRIFRGLVTPAQLDGVRMLVTQFPQEEFNATHDRKSVKPSLGVSCLDCHVNFHTTGQFHLNPDTRPQMERLRMDTVSLRGCVSRPVAVSFSTSKSTARSAPPDRWKISPNSSSARPISTEIPYGP